MPQDCKWQLITKGKAATDHTVLAYSTLLGTARVGICGAWTGSLTIGGHCRLRGGDYIDLLVGELNQLSPPLPPPPPLDQPFCVPVQALKKTYKKSLSAIYTSKPDSANGCMSTCIYLKRGPSRLRGCTLSPPAMLARSKSRVWGLTNRAPAQPSKEPASPWLSLAAPSAPLARISPLDTHPSPRQQSPLPAAAGILARSFSP